MAIEVGKGGDEVCGYLSEGWAVLGACGLFGLLVALGESFDSYRKTRSLFASSSSSSSSRRWQAISITVSIRSTAFFISA